MDPSRRRLLAAGLLLPALSAVPLACAAPRRDDDGPLFELSLAQWSLHRQLQGGQLDNLDFPVVAAERFGLRAVEYVNSFFKDKAEDGAYLEQLRGRAEAAGVRNLLIMIDGEGQLADPDDEARARAIQNHVPWIDAAAALGCHAIRVNAGGSGPRDAMAARAADSLRRLADRGADRGIAVIVENHGGPSSDGSWLADVMRRADHPGVGTLPDFGNFHIGEGQWYDRYQGVAELMPWAKAVSAKSHEFDADGNEVHTDYRRMLGIVLDAGYRGHIGIEYEGGGLSEDEGIVATRDLLLRLRDELGA